MALTTDTNEQRRQQPTLDTLLDEHLNALRVRGYSDYTVRNRLVHIRFFLRWCRDRRITTPAQITSSVLHDYAQYTFEYRKRSGEPLTIASRHARLVPLRVWFRWMLRQGFITDSLADEIELPRLGRPLLKLHDLQLDRKLIFVREGKGKRDRYVPIGGRAAAWWRRYVLQARPALASALAADTVFLSRYGGPLSRDHLTWIARRYVASAKLGKSGACHLFRHTMATLMHENGADIRCIQQMLGHADIKTTQIYTQVAIRTLQRVHAETHPAGE